MTPVFLDTAGLIAVWERADQWHAAAWDAFELLLDAGVPRVTTPYVVLECGNACARRPCGRERRGATLSRPDEDGSRD